MNLMKAFCAIVLALPLAAGCGDDGKSGDDGNVDVTPDSTDTAGETPADVTTEDGASCTYPLVDCGGECVDTNEDPDHCGSCENACGSTQVCSHGACADTCADGLTDCDRACVDLLYDVENCGACGNVCPSGQACGYEVCTSEICSPGQVYCFGHCTSLNTDILNCGTCGTACDIDTQRCQDGVCVNE
jgi:hypothetical protein